MSRSGQKTLYDRIRLILESARSGVARTANSTQVVANWLIGREIVEAEQRGKARAGYGTSLLKDLATRLKSDSMVGYSVQNLQYMRQFYITYPKLVSLGPIRHALRGKLSKENSSEISHTLCDVIPNALTKRSGIEIHHAVRGESWDPGRLHPNLSWTHYRTLLRVSRGDARAFYEIEADKNNWAARELERQINSLVRAARKEQGQGRSHASRAQSVNL